MNNQEEEYIFISSQIKSTIPYEHDSEMKYALTALMTAVEHEETADGALEFLDLFNKLVHMPPGSLSSLSSHFKDRLIDALHVTLEHSNSADELFDVSRVKEKLK